MNIRSVQFTTRFITYAVRWWRHCWTAHAWWHGLASPTQ